MLVEMSTEFKVYEDFKYTMKNGDKYVVPAGFRTDFASIPQIFHSIISKLGPQNKAAVVHDYLYSKSSHYTKTRKQADQVFLHILLEQGVCCLKAKAMYRAVRMFGALYWKKC